MIDVKLVEPPETVSLPILNGYRFLAKSAKEEFNKLRTNLLLARDTKEKQIINRS